MKKLVILLPLVFALALWGCASPEESQLETQAGKYIVTAGNGLKIFDVSEPTNPVEIASSFEGTYFTDVVVDSGKAYVSGDHGVYVFDLTDPENPTLEASAPLDVSAEKIAVFDHPSAGKLIAISSWDDDSFELLRAGDLSVLSSVTLGNGPKDFIVSGNNAYVCSDDGIYVLDISDPEDIKILGSWLEEDWAYNLYTIVLKDGKAICMGDEPTYIVFDVSNPASPTPIASRVISDAPQIRESIMRESRIFTIGFGVFSVELPEITLVSTSLSKDWGWGWDIAVDGNLAYFSADEPVIGIVDMSDPEHPTLVASVVEGFDNWQGIDIFKK